MGRSGAYQSLAGMYAQRTKTTEGPPSGGPSTDHYGSQFDREIPADRSTAAGTPASRHAAYEMPLDVL